MIEDGRIEETIAHARHILSHYPRYLPAYSLMARASMEKGDFSRASHFFQTILSSNPEDASAWMNLAQLSDDLGEVEQAAWYMERAFEIDPGNGLVRERLRQLYSQRDGVERDRIKMTPAAIARTQARSGAFRSASKRLQRILRTEPNLPPLQIAALEATLARALLNQRARASQADEVCKSLLQKLPRCFQANLIRARIYASANRAQEGAPYLDVARELDPEGSFAFSLLGPQSPLPQTRVEIPFLDYQPEQAEPQGTVEERQEDASWLDEIGQDDQPPTQPEQAQQVGGVSSATKDTQPLRPPAIQERPTEPEPAEDRLPDSTADAELAVPEWLREIQQREAEDTGAQEDLEWLQEPEPDEQVEKPLGALPTEQPEGAIPDWLAGLRPIDEDTEQEQVEPTPTEEQTMIGQVPEWLLDLGEDLELEKDKPQVVEPPPESQEPEPEAPEWLRQLETPEEEAEATLLDVEPLAAPAGSEPTGELESPLTELGLSDDPDRPVWLQELQAEITGTAPQDQFAPEPDLAQAPETSEPEQAEPQPYQWLSELGVTEVPEEEPALEPTPEEELPDWLLDLREQTSSESLAALEQESGEPEAATLEPALELEPESEPLMDAEDERKAARDLGLDLTEPEPEAAPVVDTGLELEDVELEQELPEWLQGLVTEPGPEAEEAVGALEEDQAPDWLVEPREGLVSTVADEQMPDWLDRLQEPEPDFTGEPEEIEPAPELPTDVEDLEWMKELTSAPQPDRPEPVVEPSVEQVEPEFEPAVETGVREAEATLDLEPALAHASAEPEIVEPLAEAPALLDPDALDDSTRRYEALIASGSIQEKLIAELEQAVQAHPEHSGLQRVLGDAYMQSNQLEQALEAYRAALRKL
jgi:tetratricopeptide (TPR) repeat protein